jgi:hypothetical protein
MGCERGGGERRQARGCTGEGDDAKEAGRTGTAMMLDTLTVSNMRATDADTLRNVVSAPCDSAPVAQPHSCQVVSPLQRRAWPHEDEHRRYQHSPPNPTICTSARTPK